MRDFPRESPRSLVDCYIKSRKQTQISIQCKISDALRSISMEHLAVKIRESYCQQGICILSLYYSAIIQLVQTAALLILLPSISQQRKNSHKLYHCVSPLVYIAEQV